MLVVSEPKQLRALGNDLRAKVVFRLRERAASTSELAEELGLPKGTVGHHLKVLEAAGLVRVVRTRRVRAVTEKYYGRVARLFVIRSSESDETGAGALSAASFRQAADEIAGPSADEVRTTGLVHVRLSELDVRRFERRLEKLVEDFVARETPGGATYGLVTGLYRSGPPPSNATSARARRHPSRRAT